MFFVQPFLDFLGLLTHVLRSASDEVDGAPFMWCFQQQPLYGTSDAAWGAVPTWLQADIEK